MQSGTMEPAGEQAVSAPGPRCRATLLVVLALLCGCGEPRLMTAATLDDLSLRMSSFHRQPTQDEFHLILNSFARFDGDPQIRDSASLMASFILFASDRYAFTVERAPESQALVRFRTADRVRFNAWLGDDSTSPQKNDVWWMAYFATGEDRWLDRVLAVATSAATQTEGKPAVIDLAGQTARWSYKSNAAQWSEVLSHAERHAELGNAFAKECVAYAEQHPELRRP